MFSTFFPGYLLMPTQHNLLGPQLALSHAAKKGGIYWNVDSACGPMAFRFSWIQELILCSGLGMPLYPPSSACPRLCAGCLSPHRIRSGPKLSSFSGSQFQEQGARRPAWQWP